MCTDQAIADMSKDPTSATYIPLRVRDIVRETMSSVGKRDEGYLARENVLLQKQLQHVRRESGDMEAKVHTYRLDIDCILAVQCILATLL